ncbi:hypothetical protein [Ancylobacter terrae]|uniref:hypothetical protein n=1 Tax=Ancylobacter sp. sgz301288 TaxID=3342077 RepID=UPI00385AA6E2
MRDADQFIRGHSANLGHPLVTGTLTALRLAAGSGSRSDTGRAFARTERLMRANRWGWS